MLPLSVYQEAPLGGGVGSCHPVRRQPRRWQVSQRSGAQSSQQVKHIHAFKYLESIFMEDEQLNREIETRI